MQQQGTEFIKQAVQYDREGMTFSFEWLTGKLREAIDAYKQGGKLLYDSLKCIYENYT